MKIFSYLEVSFIPKSILKTFRSLEGDASPARRKLGRLWKDMLMEGQGLHKVQNKAQ